MAFKSLARRRAATFSVCCIMAESNTSVSAVSLAKVYSWEILFGLAGRVTGRLPFAFARSRRVSVNEPASGRNRPGGVCLSWAMVCISWVFSFWARTLPTPKIFDTGKGSSICWAFCSVIIVKPSGFSRSEASLARNLLGAMPIEAMRFSSSLMACLIAVPMFSADL